MSGSHSLQLTILIIRVVESGGISIGEKKALCLFSDIHVSNFAPVENDRLDIKGLTLGSRFQEVL